MDKELLRVLLALAGAVLGYKAAKRVNEECGFPLTEDRYTGIKIGGQAVTETGCGCGCVTIILGPLIGFVLAAGLSVAILGEPPKEEAKKPAPIVPPDAPAPPSVEPAQVDPSAQVKDEIRKALGRHGVFNGDEWTTIVLRRFRDAFGREVVEEQVLAIQGLDVSCKTIEPPEADRRAGHEWGIVAMPMAASHRYVRLDGMIAQGSEVGLPSEMRKDFRAWRRTGVVYWDGDSPDIQPSSDQSDVLDTILQNMLSPALPAGKRQAIWHIVRVLSVGGGAGRNARDAASDDATKHVRVADALSTVDLAGCPPDVAAAYLTHIQAWRSNDAARIDATFEELMRRAKQYGVGTASYRS